MHRKIIKYLVGSHDIREYLFINLNNEINSLSIVLSVNNALKRIIKFQHHFIRKIGIFIIIEVNAHRSIAS